MGGMREGGGGVRKRDELREAEKDRLRGGGGEGDEQEKKEKKMEES